MYIYVYIYVYCHCICSKRETPLKMYTNMYISNMYMYFISMTRASAQKENLLKNMYKYVHMYIYIHIFISMASDIHIYGHLQNMYAYVYTCIFICLYMYIHIYGRCIFSKRGISSKRGTRLNRSL